jgi:hypothetical protein
MEIQWFLVLRTHFTEGWCAASRALPSQKVYTREPGTQPAGLGHAHPAWEYTGYVPDHNQPTSHGNAVHDTVDH